MSDMSWKTQVEAAFLQWFEGPCSLVISLIEVCHLIYIWDMREMQQSQPNFPGPGLEITIGPGPSLQRNK